MTKHVGIFEAKSRLSALISEVEQGGEVLITRNGKPVARLSSVRTLSPEEKRARVQKFLDFAREFRAGLPPTTHEEIREMIDHGRR